MVTVWPTESDGEADNLNKMYRDSLCSDAVNHYGLGQALEDINKATRQGYKFEGQGPFLLAWSPSESMNKPDALVLVLDLSNVTTSEEAKRMFDLWSRRIQQNSDLWLPGFNKLALKDEIRQWADKFGSKALSLIGIKE